ncbi:hypothetical protein [Streptacidiphilus monticola]|uniref:Uncharacterized protein n=1 Tax=Streptacidiphilus monticola TaxID=2161674 RepID=A0ABW1GAI6_9ACTN
MARLVFDDEEAAGLREQATEAEQAGETMLAASLQELAEHGVDVTRSWEDLMAEKFSRFESPRDVA